MESKNFIPQLDAVLESVVEDIEGWADSLGIELRYMYAMIEESGQHEWAADLAKQVDWAARTAETLLRARGKADLALDLKQRVDALCAAAEGYEQRLDALEDQCQVHVEGVVARYRQTFEDDPDAVRLMRLCQGIQRIWTLNSEGYTPKTPEDFAEAIDWTYYEMDGAKRRAQIEVRRQAGELAEYLTAIRRWLVWLVICARSDSEPKKSRPRYRRPTRAVVHHPWVEPRSIKSPTASAVTPQTPVAKP